MLALLLLAVLSPAERASQVAGRLTVARDALREIHLAAAAIEDPPLRAAVEAIIMAPWLPPEAYAVARPAEAERMLREAGFLQGRLELPPRRGSFQAACGGPDQPYPGGLAVRSWADLLNARGIGQSYWRVHRVKLRDEWLVAAAVWHDALGAVTLPWRDDATCGPEQRIAGAPAHHIYGIATALLRHVPEGLLLTIAGAQPGALEGGTKTVCDWLRAAAIVADGKAPVSACPETVPLEAYTLSIASADRILTSTAWSWYAARTPAGWERFEALIQDGSAVAAWARTMRR
jgi:hypothetical protein